MQISIVMLEFMFLAFGPAMALALPFGVETKKAVACFVVAALAVAQNFRRTFGTGAQHLQIGDVVHYELLRSPLSVDIALLAFLFVCAFSALSIRRMVVDQSMKLAFFLVACSLSFAAYFAANKYLSDQTIVGIVNYVKA